MSAARILVVYAHRNPATSRVNRALVSAAAGCIGVAVVVVGPPCPRPTAARRRGWVEGQCGCD